MDKKILKDEEKAKALLSSLSQRKYENRTEIKAVFDCEQKKLKYHNLVLKNVSKTTDKKTKKPVYKARIGLEKKTEKIESEKKKAGRFILATNVLKNLSPSEIITAYKGQQSCERGFKFLKDPLLGASLLGGNLRAGAPLFFALFSFPKIPVKSGNYGVKHGVIFISLYYWSKTTSELI